MFCNINMTLRTAFFGQNLRSFRVTKWPGDDNFLQLIDLLKHIATFTGTDITKQCSATDGQKNQCNVRVIPLESTPSRGENMKEV